MKFTRTEVIWTQVLTLAFASFVVAALSVALPGCNSGGGTSSSPSGITSSGGGSTGGPPSISQNAFQQVNQLNGSPGTALTSQDMQTLSGSGLLANGDQSALSPLVQK